jgi:hypothetical protein
MQRSVRIILHISFGDNEAAAYRSSPKPEKRLKFQSQSKIIYFLKIGIRFAIDI